MKKIVLAALILACSFRALADDPTVNEKVLAAFNKTFKDVQEVRWTENNFSYEVKFKQEEVISKVIYDKEGNILRTLRYYGEQQLPIMVLAKIKTRYSDKKVHCVVEESSDEGTYYHITLEDEKNWLDIKADSYGSLSVENKFKKG